MMGHMYNFGCGGMYMWIILIVAIAVSAYLFMAKPNFNRPESSETPMDILKKRYAKGEITKEQFESMKKDMM